MSGLFAFSKVGRTARRQNNIKVEQWGTSLKKKEAAIFSVELTPKCVPSSPPTLSWALSSSRQELKLCKWVTPIKPPTHQVQYENLGHPVMTSGFLFPVKNTAPLSFTYTLSHTNTLLHTHCSLHPEQSRPGISHSRYISVVFELQVLAQVFGNVFSWGSEAILWRSHCSLRWQEQLCRNIEFVFISRITSSHFTCRGGRCTGVKGPLKQQ